jgi:hypothetical protein
MSLYHDGECALDDLWEAYDAAIGELDGDQGDLREQVGKAVARVERHRKLCGAEPADASEGEVVRRLSRVLGCRRAAENADEPSAETAAGGRAGH